MIVAQLAVIGAGTMGRGIAETIATHGLPVTVVEIDAQQRQAAATHLRMSVEKAIKRHKITETDMEVVLQRITWTGDIAAVATADVVIEAAPETEAIKRSLFALLDQHTRPDAILASNTSSISITRLAAGTKIPERVIGMHFFNPVPIMTPVEIVRGVQTSAEVIEATRMLSVELGKHPFIVQDSPGFVVNRVLMPLINEAIFTLQENVADAPTIDGLMKQGCNHPMGPLELADLIGLDVCLSIMKVLHEQFGDPKFRPCPMLTRLVDAGHLGRKSGQGFYKY